MSVSFDKERIPKIFLMYTRLGNVLPAVPCDIFRREKAILRFCDMC